MIPGIAKRNGAKIIEINMEPSTYTHYITDIYLEGKSGEILPAIDALMILFRVRESEYNQSARAA